MPLGWQIAADLDARGEPLTRDTLAAALRAAGHAAGNERVGALLARLKTEAPADPAETPCPRRRRRAAMTDTNRAGEVIDFPALAAAPGPDVDGRHRRAGRSGQRQPDGPQRPATAVLDGVPDEPRRGRRGRATRTLTVSRSPSNARRLGAPVDPPDEPRPLLPRTGRDRAPVVPPWMASRAALAASVRWAVKEARYHVLFHGLRAPKYAAKTAVFAPAGAVRTAGRLARWASAEEGNWHLRQAAADRGDAARGCKLDARRQRQARWRWPLLTLATAAALAALAVAAGRPVPALVRCRRPAGPGRRAGAARPPGGQADHRPGQPGPRPTAS